MKLFRVSDKQFEAVSVSSKFAICGLPIRVDTYKTCSFGCRYCFSNCRKIMEFRKEFMTGNILSLKKRLNRIFNEHDIDQTNFLDVLMNNHITWHCGGMSDPFQHAEKRYGATERLIEATRKYGIKILFSTKSDTIYGCRPDPSLHTFQMSVTNVFNRRDIEPNVPDIKSRYELFKELKRKGFRVGIRIQPFIPEVTTTDIVDMFSDADAFTIEGIKIVPQNKEHKDYILSSLNLDKSGFKNMGLLNLRPEIRLRLYRPFIKKFEEYGLPYSIADNDLHYLGNQKCCCGDNLVGESTDFNNTALIYKYGRDYTKEQVDEEILKFSGCKCNQLFTSNRKGDCVTVQDFYDKRFYQSTSPFSPQFLYKRRKKLIVCNH